ncbi:MAG: hypothetical protein FWD46_05565 [Cystobacterineae bacterium]|nr:hypothetical protein [Cystobacterineae bacterium]
MKIFAQGLRGLWVVGFVFCMGLTCSPLEICYSDAACAVDERCFKGDEETSAVEGICLSPSCEPGCAASTETCVWDTLGWEAHCVALL